MRLEIVFALGIDAGFEIVERPSSDLKIIPKSVEDEMAEIMVDKALFAVFFVPFCPPT